MILKNMKSKFCLFISVLYILLNVVWANSQEISVELSADTNNLLIGQQVRLSLKVFPGSIRNITFPVFTDTLGKLEIIELFPIDTIKSNGKIELFKKDFIVTSFDSGSFQVEPLIITYQYDSQNDIRILPSNVITLNFETISVDTSGMEIKDIKLPIQEPITLEDLLFYFIIIFGIFILYYIIIVAFGRKRHKTVKIAPKYDPRIPADLEALEALQRLDKENLWQKGMYKLYHSNLTDILRVYMHRRYHLNALEMTSNELLDEIKRYESNNAAIQALIEILNIADLAKFAKYEPKSEENINSMKFALLFVNTTKVVDIDEEDEKNDINSGDEK